MGLPKMNNNSLLIKEKLSSLQSGASAIDPGLQPNRSRAIVSGFTAAFVLHCFTSSSPRSPLVLFHTPSSSRLADQTSRHLHSPSRTQTLSFFTLPANSKIFVKFKNNKTYLNTFFTVFLYLRRQALRMLNMERDISVINE